MSDQSSVQNFIALEGHLLDDRQYDDWLALYAENAEYWVPSSDDGQILISDPQSEISLIYYPSRAGLEDRVFRIGTKKSSASFPPPRTTHMVSNIMITDSEDARVNVKTSWATYSYKHTKTSVLHGYSEYRLQRFDWENNWKIDKKKVVIQNDYLEHAIDFYSIY